MINYNYIILHFSLLHKTKCKHYTHTQIKEYLETVIYIHVVMYIIYLQILALESYKMLAFFFFYQTLGLTYFRGKILSHPLPCYHVCHIFLLLV